MAAAAEIEEEVKNGLVQEGDDWYYYENGEKVTDTERTIYDENDNGKVYRFDENGKMITGWFCIEEEDEYSEKYYYFPDGHRAEGIQEIDGKTYYFNGSGEMLKYREVIENATFYYFGSDGSMTVKQSLAEDGWITVDGNYYYAKNQDIVRNDFVTSGGYTYYMNYDGRMLTNTTFRVYNDDSYYDYKEYRVDSDGHLVTGWYQEDEDSEQMYYYNADGSSAKGVQTINGNTYYFSEDGLMLRNYTIIDGGYFYYFDENGIQQNKQSSSTDGWAKGGDTWYYIKDGQLVKNDFVTVDGYTYYMDINGKMGIDGEYMKADPEDGFLRAYRVDKSGHVIKGWYCIHGDLGDVWYYYLEDGRNASDGIREINGKTYCFAFFGRMQCNYTIEVNGALHYFGEDGVQKTVQSLSKDGWVKSGDTWYYAKDNKIVRDKFLTIGNYTYYLDGNGEMRKNSQINRYDEEAKAFKYYRLDASGHLVKGWYQDEDSNTYYYSADGSLAEGLQTINGKTYYFDKWYGMKKNSVIVMDGVFYSFGNDGVQTVRKDLTEDGWVNADGKWYYVKNQNLVRNEFLTVGNNTYYMGSAGEMYTDTTFSQYDSECDEYKYYRVDSKGHLIKGWYKEVTDDGEGGNAETLWYYYLSDGSCAEGIQTVNGKTYYFAENGVMQRNIAVESDGYLCYFGSDGTQQSKQAISKDGWIKAGSDWYYVKNGTLVKNQFVTSGNYTYYMGNYGTMYVDIVFSVYDEENDEYTYYRTDAAGHLVKGWYQEQDDDEWYYYLSDGSQAIGIHTINGKTYYFSRRGVMQKNAMAVENGYLYYFDKNGVQQTKQSMSKNGWAKGGGKWYYIKDKELVKEEFLKIGDYTYYFDYSGKMAVDTDVYVYNDETSEDIYHVDEKGHMVTGWQKYDDVWYYYGTDGRGASGVQTVNGKTYYFSEAQMLTDRAAVSNGYLYYFGEDGVQQSKQSISKDGWMKAGDNWYYAKDKQLVKRDFLKVGGYTYYLDSDGRMMVNQAFWSWDKDDNEYVYYADASGHLVTGWQNISDDDEAEWYYFGTDYRAVIGIQTINGKTYYFNYNGLMKTDYVVAEAGYLWYFGENGVQELKQSLSKDGWVKIKSNWYYLQNQDVLRGSVKKIGSYSYAFDGDGKMVVDNTVWISEVTEENEDSYCYRTDAQGHIITGWYKDTDSESWYYYGKEGRAASGFTSVGSSQYYFESDGRMTTNRAYAVDGTLYYFGSDGKVSASVSMKTDGWKKLSGGYYYVKSGSLVTDEKVLIGQYTYYFNYEGRMVEDTTIWNDDHCYRFDSQGHMVTGWYHDGFNWYYYDSNGQSGKGIQKLGNTVYYFGESGWMQINKKAYYDGKLYAFGVNGVGSVYTKNGWADGKYYLENGKPVTGWKKISGKWYYFDTKKADKYSSDIYSIGNADYYFDAYGQMKTGIFKKYDGTKLFAGADGKLKEDGWYQDTDGKWYYLVDYNCVTGAAYINNKCNIFHKDGSWVKEIPSTQNGWLKSNGTYYYFTNGKPVQDEKKTIGGKIYFFDDEGAMLKNQMHDGYYLQSSGAALVNGWGMDNNVAGVVRYYGADGKYVTKTWKKIDGNWYYLDTTGRRVQNDEIIDGKLYHFDSNGVSNGIGTAMTNGWNLVNGNYYYVANSQLAKGIKNIGGKKYYFYSDGTMAFDRNVSVEENDEWVSYYAGINGELAVNKWCNNHRNYAGSNGKLYTGLKTINGQKYLFDESGYLYLTSTVSEDGKTVYTIKSNGVVTASQTAKNNGWVKTSDGSWFYANGGKFVRNEGLVIGGKNYYFMENGRMFTSGSMDGIGYADSNGIFAADGWYGSMYFVSGNAVWNDTMEINGKYYLFVDGQSTAGYWKVDGDFYYFDGKGNKTLKSFATGWNKIGTDWYYVSEAGTMYRNISIKIGSEYYYFNSYGVMAKNYLYQRPYYNYEGRSFLYYGADGKRIKNCWKQVDGRWYYFDANGWSLVGKHKIGGKWYIFGMNGLEVSE